MVGCPFGPLPAEGEGGVTLRDIKCSRVSFLTICRTKNNPLLPLLVYPKRKESPVKEFPRRSGLSCPALLYISLFRVCGGPGPRVRRGHGNKRMSLRCGLDFLRTLRIVDVATGVVAEGPSVTSGSPWLGSLHTSVSPVLVRPPTSGKMGPYGESEFFIHVSDAHHRVWTGVS